MVQLLTKHCPVCGKAWSLNQNKYELEGWICPICKAFYDVSDQED